MMKRLMRHPAAAPDYAMCFDPGTVLFTVGATEVTLGAVATAASIAGTAVSVMSAMNQGAAMQKQAEYNAQVAERQALAARQAASLEEERHRDKTRKLLSSQRAAIAASGLDLEGSPLAVMEETAAEAELDALLIRHSGNMSELQAKSQAAADRLAGRTARIQGYYGAGASLLNGVSALGRTYGPKSSSTNENNWGDSIGHSQGSVDRPWGDK